MEIRNKKITIVGTGRLAHSLAHHLIQKGFEICAVIGRTKTSAEEFAHKFHIPSYGNSIAEIPSGSKVILLMVPDSKIRPTAEKIAYELKDVKGRLFVHFSGTETTEDLSALKRKKALTASFHIMQTFPSRKIVNIKNSYAAVETANEDLLLSLFNFAKQLGLIPFRITPANKIVYHLTGVFTANLLASHFYNAVKAFEYLKIGSPQYFDLFSSIINETLKNLRTGRIGSSLSGPVVRKDLETIKKHIGFLKKKKEDLLLLNYLVESLTLVKIIIEEGGDREGYKSLNAYLSKELKQSFKYKSE